MAILIKTYWARMVSAIKVRTLKIQIRKIIKHIKNRSLCLSINAIVLKHLGKIARGKSVGYFLEKSARNFLLQKSLLHFELKNKGLIVLIGDNNNNLSYIRKRLIKLEINVKVLNINNINKLEGENTQNISSVICTYHDAKRATLVAKYLLHNDNFKSIPFEFKIIPELEYSVFQENDQYDSISFVSPLLLNNTDVFKIYENSLKLFEKKCQIRDYMDLCQIMNYIYDNSIKGDFAEFGSYKGHSGYLIASLLKVLSLEKHLFMFDTFEHFPEEQYGIDYFWSDTHKTSYNDVSSKFSNLNNVTLVKGDFTKTFKRTNINSLALAYVDCDSYRGINYLINEIYDNILAKGGVMIFEDYGHPRLLGARLAVHEYFDKMHGCLKFFSQFSGFYIVVKN